MIAIIHYYFHLNFFLSMSVSIVTILHEWESVFSANKCWNVQEYWFPYTADIDTTDISVLRDGPLENSWGGGGSRYEKKNSRKGKLNEKNSCTPINPKKYSCYGLKKIHTRNLITKKIPAARKFPSPAITFLMVRPLPGFSTLGSTGPIEKLKEGQEGEKLVRLLDTVTRMFNSQVRVRVNPSPFLR